MTRYIDLAAMKRMIAEKDLYRLSEAVVGEKAIAPIKGKERTGAVVYRRKVEYELQYENKD